MPRIRIFPVALMVLLLTGPLAGAGAESADGEPSYEEVPETSPGLGTTYGEEPDAPEEVLAVPLMMPFQGFLTDNNGNPIHNVSPGVDFEIRLWNAQSGGSQLWLESHLDVPVRQGVFTMTLGTTNPLNPAHFTGGNVFIGIKVSGEAELPRTQLLSSAFTIRARDADQANGVAPGGAVTTLNELTDGVSLVGGANVTVTEQGNDIVISATAGAGDSDWEVTGNDMKAIPTGNVGIGTAGVPASKLHVSGGAGSVELRLEADTDNSNEADHPVLTMSQDNGTMLGKLGFFGPSGVDNDIKLLHILSGDTLSLTLQSTGDNILANGDVIMGGGPTQQDGNADYLAIQGRSGDWIMGVQNELTTADTDFYIGQTTTEDAIFHIERDGDVGIGTTAPWAGLSIVETIDAGESGQPAVSIFTATAQSTGLTISTADATGIDLHNNSLHSTLKATNDHPAGLSAEFDGTAQMERLRVQDTSFLFGPVIVWGSPLSLRNQALDSVFRLEPAVSGGPEMYFYSDADDTNPTIAIDGFENDASGQIMLYRAVAGGSQLSVEIDGGAPGPEPGAIKLYRDNGGTPEVAIELDADQGGSSRIITDVVEIRGSDFSERFDVRGEPSSIRPGTVVSIDPASEGGLVVSDRAHDHRVAGIVSGAGGVRTGMVMGQSGTLADGAYPVAMTGRVYCLADASYSAIDAGDLLTTSPTPGHAMRVQDATVAQGAVIGKAMTSLKSGRGLILVLVNLQ